MNLDSSNRFYVAMHNELTVPLYCKDDFSKSKLPERVRAMHRSSHLERMSCYDEHDKFSVAIYTSANYEYAAV